ncbi:MAG TPA: alpha/beta fold hydrolase [Microlunatus sp.]|nr:alpha/beta fold hydrolase [Microlunatus sp.]
MVTTSQVSESGQLDRPPRPTKGRIGLIVAVSMAAGLTLAVLLVGAPFMPASENVLTGAVLLAFAVGWALLAVLSMRFTDQPQRWAVVPAVFMAVAGLVALSGLVAVQAVFAWIWPPVLLGLVVWTFLRIRRDMHSRAGRWLLYPVLAVLVVASIGGGFETVRESLDAKAYPMPGQLIDVGGHRLHLQCTGSGSPTVVLQPGGGASSSDVAWIAASVARHTRVCVYDRPGRGWSDATSAPEDSNHIATELHTLLDSAHEPGPYVLAGHSFGGLYVQSFAAQYPDQVAGMVLLDSTAPKPGPAGPIGNDSSNLISRASLVISSLAHFGLGRLIAQSSYATLPPRVRDEARANAATARNLDSFLKEFLLESDTSMHQASSLTSLNGKPLIVVTADQGITDPQWQSKQAKMAKLSTNTVHRHANATHDSLIADEADSAAASQAILDVVAAVRTSHPLS